MGRRSVHTADELRELILQASTELIESHGLAGLSAREIARRIDYSPGTLYNVFENLDDLVLTIEGRLLDRLSAALADVAATSLDPRERVLRLASAYLKFTHGNPKLWNLLFEHHLPPERDVPAWYQQKLEGLLSRVEEALAPLMNAGDPQALKRSPAFCGRAFTASRRFRRPTSSRSSPRKRQVRLSRIWCEPISPAWNSRRISSLLRRPRACRGLRCRRLRNRARRDGVRSGPGSGRQLVLHADDPKPPIAGQEPLIESRPQIA